MDKQVLAKVGENEITRQEMMNTIMSLPKEQINQFSSAEGRKQLLDEMVARELLYLDAKEQNMEEDEAYQKQLEEAREYLLKQYAVQKLVGGITAEEEEIREYYDTHRGQFVKGPQVRARHILVKEEEEARTILNQIKNGEMEFEDAAKKHSTCPSKDRGGDLGFFGQKQMVPEFDKVVFSMEVGDLSHIVKTQFGYHIIKLEEKKDQEIQSFDQVKQQIQQYLVKNKQNQKYINYTMELKEKYPVEINEDALK